SDWSSDVCSSDLGRADEDTGEIAFGAPELCHTEVEDFDAPVAGKKNVFRLEVAVEDAFIMCCNQPSEQFGARNLSLCGRAPDETESAGEASHLPEVPSLSKVSPGRALFTTFT